MEENYRDIAEEGDDKKKIHEMRWEVYVKEKEELIKGDFWCPFHIRKGGIIWTCVKDPIIDEKNQYKAIGIRVFDFKLFEEEEGGGTRVGLYGYPYLKHLIQLWLGDRVNQMEKLNEEVGTNNFL